MGFSHFTSPVNFGFKGNLPRLGKYFVERMRFRRMKVALLKAEMRKVSQRKQLGRIGKKILKKSKVSRSRYS